MMKSWSNANVATAGAITAFLVCLIAMTMSLASIVSASQPVPIFSRTGSGDLIYGHSMDIASDGRIFVAAEVTHLGVREIVVFRSDDSGETWSLWSTIGSPTAHHRWPSIHIAEGSSDRVFLAYATVDELGDPDVGTIRVAHHALDAPTPSWTTTVLHSTDQYASSTPIVRSDAHLRSDYGVWVAFSYDVKFFEWVGIGRSTNQGATWQDPYSIEHTIIFGGRDLDLAFGPDDYVQLVTTEFGSDIVVERAANRAASSSDWELHGLLNATNVDGRNPHIVVRPGTDEVTVAYTSIATGTTLIHASADAGASWTPAAEANEVGVRDGELALGPLGYRLSGYIAPSDAIIGEPETMDPSGPWTLHPTEPVFTTTHPEPVQIDWDPSHGNQWAIVGHRENGAEESLLFYGEWFDETASVPSGIASIPGALRLAPNPAWEEVWIAASDLPGEGKPISFENVLEILDAQGRRVQTGSSVSTSSDGRLHWSLRTEDGAQVPIGTYFVRLRLAHERSVGARLTIVR